MNRVSKITAFAVVFYNYILDYYKWGDGLRGLIYSVLFFMNKGIIH